MVFDYVLEKSGTMNKYTHALMFEENDSVEVVPMNTENIRSNVVIICDGLPHLLAIQVIENCFVCQTCDLKFETLPSVTVHKTRTYHKSF